MHAKQGKVSILMNCFNGEAYLKEAIDSVINQTYSDWELIFWDNQSEDRSAEIYKSYKDSRLMYYYAPMHTVLYEARNQALIHATGEFVAFLDVDDWWFPKKLESQIKLFSDGEIGFVCSNYLVSRKRRVWQSFQSPKPEGLVLSNLLKDYYVGLLTLMVRRSALNPTSPIFNSNYHIIGDFDLVIRLASTCKMGVIQEPLAVNRIHGSNESIKSRKRQIDEIENWLSENRHNPAIGPSENFVCVRDKNLYFRAVDSLLSGERTGVLKYLLKMRFGIYSIYLIGGLLLPTQTIRWLANRV